MQSIKISKCKISKCKVSKYQNVKYQNAKYQNIIKVKANINTIPGRTMESRVKSMFMSVDIGYSPSFSHCRKHIRRQIPNHYQNPNPSMKRGNWQMVKALI